MATGRVRLVGWHSWDVAKSRITGNQQVVVGRPIEDMEPRGRRGILKELKWSGSQDAEIASGSAPDNACGME